MKLSVKIAGAFALVLACLLLLQSWIHVRQFSVFHQAEVEDDLTQLAATLATASERLASQGAPPSEISSYLRDADTQRQTTSVVPSRALRDVPFETRRAANGRSVRVGRVDHHTVVETELVGSSGPLWVSVRRSEAEREAFVRDLAAQQLLIATLLILAAIIGGLLLGRHLIVRPVNELLEQMSRVGGGDFALGVRPARNDEFGQLQSNLDGMVVRLRDLDARLSKRRREHERLLVRLRHADRLSTVGRLASGLAHELGTPLNVIAGRTKMIARAHPEHAATAKNARIVAEQAERMTQLIGQLLDFSRRAPQQLEPARVSEVVAQCLALFEMLVDQQNIRVATALTVEEPYALDTQKLLQVLTNLMQNAVHAMPEGGAIEVGARRSHMPDPPSPRCSAGTYLEFWVTDSGVGMDGETLEHALEPFFTTKSKGRGTGLGLSICDSLVKSMGGWMTIESTPGAGSTFRFFIPARDPSPASRAAPSPASQRSEDIHES